MWSDDTLSTALAAKLALDGVVDAATLNMATAWGAAWDRLTLEFRDAIDAILTANDGVWPSRTKILRARRAQEALTAAADAISKLSATADAIITRYLAVLMTQAGHWEQAIIGTQLPPGYPVVKFPTVALNKIVERTTRTVHKLTKPLSRESVAWMKVELVKGVAVGDHNRAVATSILSRVGTAFNGGLTRARVIARTEMIDAYRAAEREIRSANPDVVQGWVWISALDRRTCPACVGMHGSIHPADEPGPLGHQCCRCTAAPKTATWRDLGIDLDEPPELRVETGPEWFEQQPVTVQKSILGKGRYDAWAAGDIDWSDMVVRRSNDGWRDSYVTAPLAA